MFCLYYKPFIVIRLKVVFLSVGGQFGNIKGWLHQYAEAVEARNTWQEVYKNIQFFPILRAYCLLTLLDQVRLRLVENCLHFISLLWHRF